MSTIALKKVDIANGETISYREREGGEQVVILVHGNMTSSKHWDVVLEAMPSQFKLYAVDLRGFGLSTYHEPIKRIKDFSDDLRLFVDELHLQNFSLVGWSTGGAVCMQFVGEYPGYCDKLILLASASTRGYPLYAIGENGTFDVSKRLKTYEDVQTYPNSSTAVQHAFDKGNREFFRSVWNTVIYRAHQPEQRRYEEYLDDMLTQRNLLEVNHSLNTFNISNHDHEAAKGTGLVDHITIPTLVLRGDQDLVVTKEMTDEILADLGSNAVFYSLTGCGHSPLIDDLEQLIHQITSFVNQGGIVDEIRK
ncbi:alpha/beta fold hydrolase [Priestia koreensis]|uniref:intracellular short-chain-length polyhydroxyalkanoate depolymerase n=1 Tax=Priestia koreensis TaxID=284581 RepID=UPI00203D7E4C|nr:alpha/beta hydrolase [Priestia koreensis]MCM3004794.1 alpha/beta hydrolase [Priestia koreensis]